MSTTDEMNFWTDMMAADGTQRSNTYQRAYVRGVVGKNMGYESIPPLHYATEGQCKKIIEHFGSDPAEIDRRGGLSGTAVTWLLPLVGSLLVVVGLLNLPWGLLIVVPVIASAAMNLYSRMTAEYPFGPEGAEPSNAGAETVAFERTATGPATLPPEDWTDIIDVDQNTNE